MKTAERWDKNTLGELMNFMAPALWRGKSVPRVLAQRRRAPGWPPDVFAMCAAALHATGAHRRLFSDKGVGDHPVADTHSWPRRAREIGASWKDAINSLNRDQLDKGNGNRSLASQLNANPALLKNRSGELDEWWRRLIHFGQTPLADLFDHEEIPALLMQILVVADEASAGIGITRFKRNRTFLMFVDSAMAGNRNRSCCADVSLQRASVLPKQHTPTKGLTLRSLTHHLSYVPSSGVSVEWLGQLENRSDSDEPQTEVNLLLAPWPVKFSPSNFHSLDSGFAGDYELFGYWPESDADDEKNGRECQALTHYLDEAYRQALFHVDKLHMLVMPEMSVTQRQYATVVEPWAITKGVAVVAGVCDRKQGKDRMLHYNRCILQTGGLSKLRDRWGDLSVGEAIPKGNPLAEFRVEQSKHHRWLLDRSQIVQYGLSGRIPAFIGRKYWEDICIDENHMKIVTVLGWLTCGALICEDLARQDNVSETIRSIGPNLMIAILMDGPQIRQRWPAKYASVLAEDPGSSVLTLTSLAMTHMSRPAPGHVDRSGVVALWHDAQHGEVEIEMTGKQNAAVLSLIRHGAEELTADGRSDDGVAYQPVFAGYNGLEVSPNQ